MSSLPPFDHPWFCPNCNILQPYYQRCKRCHEIFELHCGRVGVCFRFNPPSNPLSPDGLCRNCVRRDRDDTNQPGPSGQAPPPPPPPPPGGSAGASGSGTGNHPASGSGTQQQQSPSRRQQPQDPELPGGSARSPRRPGSSLASKRHDNKGYGDYGDSENGWWRTIMSSEIDNKKMNEVCKRARLLLHQSVMQAHERQLSTYIDQLKKSYSIPAKTPLKPNESDKKEADNNQIDEADKNDDSRPVVMLSP